MTSDISFILVNIYDHSALCIIFVVHIQLKVISRDKLLPVYNMASSGPKENYMAITSAIKTNKTT